MLSNEDKLYLVNLTIDFWEKRLQESSDSIAFLNDLNNQVKIDSNLLDIENYAKIILALKEEREALTNQG